MWLRKLLRNDDFYTMLFDVHTIIHHILLASPLMSLPIGQREDGQHVVSSDGESCWRCSDSNSTGHFHLCIDNLGLVDYPRRDHVVDKQVRHLFVSAAGMLRSLKIFG